MIKTILGWLWNFNHKHQWEFKDKHEVSASFGGTVFGSTDLVYSCKCGAITTIEQSQ